MIARPYRYIHEVVGMGRDRCRGEGGGNGMDGDRDKTRRLAKYHKGEGENSKKHVIIT